MVTGRVRSLFWGIRFQAAPMVRRGRSRVAPAVGSSRPFSPTHQVLGAGGAVGSDVVGGGVVAVVGVVTAVVGVVGVVGGTVVGAKVGVGGVVAGGALVAVGGVVPGVVAGLVDGVIVVSGGAGGTVDIEGKVVETASVVDRAGATVVAGRLVAGDVGAGRVVAGAVVDGALVVVGAVGPPGRETVGRGRPALATRGRAALTDPTKAIDTATAQVNPVRVRSWGCVFMPPGCAAPLWRFHEGLTKPWPRPSW